MGNEEYQRLLRADAGEVRERLPAGDGAIARAIADLDDAALLAALRDLGGHDLGALLDALPRHGRGRRPPLGRLRLHDQGLAAADRGPPEQPLRAADRAQLGELAARWGPTRRTRGAGSPRAAPRPSCARPRRRRLARAPVPVRAPPAVPARRPGAAHGSGSTQQALGPPAARPRPRGARGGGPRRDGVARRRDLDEPRRLDQPGRDLVAGRAHRLVRRRPRDARALARGRARPPRRARDRRGQPRRPAGRARRHVVARRRAAAAGGDDLRPVRDARARAVVVRDLRRRPVDPRRDAQRRDARPGGRRPPVRGDSVDRHRAARLRELGAGLHAGLRVGLPARPGAARPPRRDGVVLPALDPPARPGAGGRARRPAGGRTCSRAATCCGRPGRGRSAWASSAWARWSPRRSPPPSELGGAEVVLLTSPDLVFRALQARWGLRDGDDAILGRLFATPRPLVTVLDGHPHSLGFLAAVHGVPVACLGVTEFGQSGDIADLYRHHGLDAETIVGAALDLAG